MANRKLVFLSDVHIGANTPVNWYQKDVHEGFLLAALAYIRDAADDIDELVVLGDLVDLWTYLPDQPPARFKDVVAANPAVFGDGSGSGKGLLEQVLTALQGRVSFMNGNHDMTVVQADLDLIRGRQGQAMRLVDTMTYFPKAGLGKVVCTHGHIFSVFCAPDSDGLSGCLPIGYFVTRLAAQWDLLQLKTKYPPGSTVADMPNAGTPTAWGFNTTDVERIAWGVLHHQRSLAELLFDVIIGDSAEKQKRQTFIMPDGSRPNAYDLARTTYKSTYDTWVKWADRYPDIFGDPTVDRPGPFALKEVDFDDSLLHFAKVLGESSKVVVMGHTHAPDDEIDYPWYIKALGESLYVNCGFNCPSRPDMAQPANPKHPTFVELEIDDAARVFKASVRYVVRLSGGGYAVAPDPLEQAKIPF